MTRRVDDGNDRDYLPIQVIRDAIRKPRREKPTDLAAINSQAAYFFIQEAGKQLDDGGKICAIVTLLLAGYTGLHSTYEGMKAPVEHFTRAASKESP